jgi:hypothetical protein
MTSRENRCQGAEWSRKAAKSSSKTAKAAQRVGIDGNSHSDWPSKTFVAQTRQMPRTFSSCQEPLCYQRRSPMLSSVTVGLTIVPDHRCLRVSTDTPYWVACHCLRIRST